MKPQLRATLYLLGHSGFIVRHYVATWLRWFAYCIDRRNQTLGGCGCRATERPWPLPVMKHSKVCRLS